MKRRELGTALIGAAAYSVLPGGAQAQSPGAPYYSPTAAEMSASSRGVVVKQPEYSPSPIYDMARYGLTANNAGNHPKNGEIGAANSRIMQAVFAMVAATGGTIEFPHGDWSFHLDISGINNTVIIEGNGSTFRTFNPAAPGGASESSAVAGTAVVHGDNTSRSWLDSNVTFRNCDFTAVAYSPHPNGANPGDAAYCVELHGTTARFWNCSFSYGRKAAFYAHFGQYTEFWSCRFAAAVASRDSAGCILDSRGLASSSNEVLFSRCKFFSNSNGLVLKGTQLTRIRDCTIQDTRATGRGGIVLEADATGSFCGATLITGCWFEMNAVPHILGLGHVGTIIRDNVFWPTQRAPARQTSVLQFGTSTAPNPCYDLKIVDNSWLGGGDVTVSIVHPPTNRDTAALTWRGNGSGRGGPLLPTSLVLTHDGPTYIDGPNYGSSLSK